jgi:hypothetical protein
VTLRLSIQAKLTSSEPDEERQMNDSKTWYMSKTVWGGVVVILASCANLLGLEIAPEDESGVVDGLTALAAAVGGLIAIWGRISARSRLR